MSKDRPFGIKYIVYGKDEDIEYIASKEVCYGHIRCADFKGCDGYHHFRKRCGHGNKNSPDKTSSKACLFSKFIAYKRKPCGSAYDEQGIYGIFDNSLFCGYMFIVERLNHLAYKFLYPPPFKEKHAPYPDKVNHNNSRAI